MLVEEICKSSVIGSMKPVQPQIQIGTDIAGDKVAVAIRWDDRGIVLLSVQIHYKATDSSQMRGHIVPPCQPLNDALDADIDRDVLIEQFGRNAQRDIFRHEVRSVIGNAYYAGCVGHTDRVLADLFVREVVYHLLPLAQFSDHSPPFCALG